jgi:tetratricopeptide (TPR) repeat protein
VSARGKELDRLAELEDERRFLLKSLEDLDRELAAGDVQEDDYRVLKDGYTARAAAVIREIESGRDAAIAPRRPIRWGRVVSITVGMIAFGVLAGWLVARYSGQDVPDAAEALDPDDKVGQLLAEARQLEPIEAIRKFGEVLELEPGNVEALTYSGWYARLIAVQQQPGAARDALLDAAQDKLQQAVAADPTYPDAQCFLAVTLFRDREDAAAAKPHLAECEASNPPAMVKGMVGSLATEIDAALTDG